MTEVLGDAALLVEPTDVERIFEASRRILAEPEYALELAGMGTRRSRDFTWNECARWRLLAYREATKPASKDPKLTRTI
jgi:hypothetical protein